MQLQQLLKECKKGSVTAQKYLFDEFATQFFLLCRRYMRNDSVAEEIMSTGFLKIFQSLHQFEYSNDISAKAWMKKIMVNECLQVLRQKNNFLMVAEDVAEEIEVNEEAIMKLNADEIYKLITQLPIGYRTVFNLFVIEGMSHKEIAVALNITEGTSKSQLSKARKVLQQLFTEKNELYVNRKAR
jgi:RNA polymerase sigma-70 factor (ECF subfamily)